MSDSKRDYERGYHDAREGKENKGSFGLGAILPGKTDADSVAYQKGYREGKEDRERNKK